MKRALQSETDYQFFSFTSAVYIYRKSASLQTLSVLTEFDRQWGIADADEGVFRDAFIIARPVFWTLRNNGRRYESAEDYFFNNLSLVRNESKYRLRTLKCFGKPPFEDSSRDLLPLFAVDLLGRATYESHIFRNYESTTCNRYAAVPLYAKYLVVTALVLFNLAMIAVSISFGSKKPRDWQYSWLSSCVIAVVLDGTWMELCFSIWEGCIIPCCCLESFNRARSIIIECIDTLDMSQLNNTATSSSPATAAAASTTGSEGSAFDFASYMFVSTRLAKLYPSILESRIVLNYKSIYPSIVPLLWVRNTLSSTRSSGLCSWNYWSKGILWLQLAELAKCVACFPRMMQYWIISSLMLCVVWIIHGLRRRSMVTAAGCLIYLAVCVSGVAALLVYLHRDEMVQFFSACCIVLAIRNNNSATPTPSVAAEPPTLTNMDKAYDANLSSSDDGSILDMMNRAETDFTVNHMPADGDDDLSVTSRDSFGNPIDFGAHLIDHRAKIGAIIAEHLDSSQEVSERQLDNVKRELYRHILQNMSSVRTGLDAMSMQHLSVDDETRASDFSDISSSSDDDDDSDIS